MMATKSLILSIWIINWAIKKKTLSHKFLWESFDILSILRRGRGWRITAVLITGHESDAGNIGFVLNKQYNFREWRWKLGFKVKNLK